VVESTSHWYWLVDGLMEAGDRGHLANPAAMQPYNGLQYTDDRSDARWLAQVLRLGGLPEGYIYPKADRAVRDVWRKRAPVVRQHTANVRRGPNILVRHTGMRFSAKRLHECTKADREGLLPEVSQGLVVTSSLALLHWLRQQLTTLEKAVTTSLHHTPAYEPWLSVDGIGPIVAQTMGLETGPMGRFPTVGQDASYWRWVTSTTISHGKRQGRGNIKNGNPSLEWASMEAAQCAIRCSPTVPQFYQRKPAKSHLMVARKAVAHKLSRACYDMMRDLVPLEVHKAFG
jgi:transposase